MFESLSFSPNKRAQISTVPELSRQSPDQSARRGGTVARGMDPHQPPSNPKVKTAPNPPVSLASLPSQPDDPSAPHSSPDCRRLPATLTCRDVEVGRITFNFFYPNLIPNLYTLPRSARSRYAPRFRDLVLPARRATAGAAGTAAHQFSIGQPCHPAF